MFWKLNRNNREQDMRELSQLLSAFFSYAAAQGGTNLDEDALLRAFPKSAPWLLEQFHGTEKNRKKLQKAIKDLFLLPVSRRQEIARAVAHDMEFDQPAGQPLFFFAVPSLRASEQKIVKAFFLYFYDVCFHHAQGPAINGHTNGATRDQFLIDYFQANDHLLQACPVCLNRKSNARKETDLEHYFPKGVYSPLILHPSNLFFICKDCNETYKGTRDALRKRGGPKPLRDVFLPYQDTVKDHTTVTFRRKAGTDHIELRSASGDPAEQEKINNFDYLYQLEDRWSADIEGIFKQLRTHCTGQNPEKRPKEEVRETLQRKCEELQSLSDFPDRYVESAYLHWLCETMFDAFYDSLWDDPPCAAE